MFRVILRLTSALRTTFVSFPRQHRGVLNSRRYGTIIQDAYIGGIPGQVDPKATERMIRLAMEHWDAPLADFLNQTKVLLEGMVFDRVQQVFGHRSQTKYFDEIFNVCRAFLESAMAVQLQVTKQLLGYEMAKPKTLNDRMMTMARDEALVLLQNARRVARAAKAINDQESKSQKFTQGQQRVDKINKLPEDQLSPELFQPELKAMSVSPSRSYPIYDAEFRTGDKGLLRVCLLKVRGFDLRQHSCRAVHEMPQQDCGSAEG